MEANRGILAEIFKVSQSFMARALMDEDTSF